MATFLYRCPHTGVMVQAVVADPTPQGEVFEPVICIACTRVHLVNPKTGKVLGGASDDK
jgi:hypothetical protein